MKWSSSIIDGLLSKINVSKYTKRFFFCGTNQLVLDLFNKSGVEFQIFKERVLYECKSVKLLNKQCEGAAFFSTTDDLETVAEMTYKYGIEEWGEREGRDLDHARQLSYQSILQETNCHWELEGKITTIASVLDSDTELPIISSLYTNPDDRGRGYAKCLVYEITRQNTIINDKGEILNFVITQGNVDDREPLKNERFVEAVKGKLYADKGYLSKELGQILFVDGLHLITSIRNNMKNCLMELKDKILLRKRSVIETVNDELKNMCQVEHSRHRSFGNFITNMLSGLIAYSFFPKKPAIKYETANTTQIALF